MTTIDTQTSDANRPRWPFRTFSKISLSSRRSTAPTSPTLQSSSAEEDELLLSLPRNPEHKYSVRSPSPLRKPTNNSDSYFPRQTVQTTVNHKPSPLSSSSAEISNPSFSDLLASAVGDDDDDDDDDDGSHDYGFTSSLGYFILLLTYLIFVVGMGSCLGIWSWAWDVGETPYAPPELEDDPTLPITGYYPALMVLTAVMAWVWVTCAWVGMKYFRHAAGG